MKLLLSLLLLAAWQQPGLDEDLEAVRAYRFGESRSALARVEAAVLRACSDPNAADELEGRLLQLLGAGATPDGTRFVCQQLGRIGTGRSVPAIHELLKDERYAATALSTLESIPDPQVDAVLLEELQRADPGARIALVQALARRASEDAAAELCRAARSSDEALAEAAIRAVAEFDTDETVGALLALAEGLPESHPRTAALIPALLRAGEVQFAHGHLQPATALWRAAWKRPELAAHEQAAALRGLLEVRGPAYVRLLLAWLGGNDPELQRQAAAIARAVENEEVIRPLLSGIPQLPDGSAALLVDALSERGSPALVSALRSMYDMAGPELRTASLRAFGRHGDGKVVGTLLAEAARGSEVARESLRQLQAAEVDAALVESLADGNSAARVAALVALAERRADVGVAGVLPLLDEADAGVSLAARDALAPLARAAADREAAVGRIRAKYESLAPEARAEMLAVFAHAGGETALRTLREALQEKASRSAAVLALALWEDSSPADDLWELAEATPDPELRRLALASFLNLAGRIAWSEPERAAAMLREAWPATADELGPSASESALDVAQAIGEALPEAAMRMARAVLARHPEGPLHERAAEIIDRIERDRDYILGWEFAGPYAVPEAADAAPFDVAFAPEGEPDSVRWQRLPAVPERPRVFDLARALGGENCCAYVRTRVWSNREREVRLEIGSDDGVAAWLNGEPIHRNDVMRGLTPGDDRLPATLREGENELMLKVTQGGGDWAFCCRVRDPSGLPAKGVSFAERLEWPAPPGGALRLVDGDRRLDAWEQADGGPAAWRFDEGVLEVVPGSGSLVTRDVFDDFTLHLGFCLPEPPRGAEGQARSNSGVYLQGRYEIQVLDSWGLAPADNGCGAIYGLAAPAVNASRPPGRWQSYHVEFEAPRWDGEGRKFRNARVSVWHNGVLIHDRADLSGSTGSGRPEADTPGPILLQDHGDPVRYRDVWIVPMPSGWEGAGAAGFEPLFDGATLSGWRRLGGAAEFRVEDGQIVGAARAGEPNSFLCTEREFGDFVLELQFKVDDVLNSGVQIRSHSRPAAQGEVVYGYQVDIDPSARSWTGGLYDEARGAFRPGAWNRLRIEARGDRLRTWVNGVPAAELRDGADSSGFLGLQVHGVGGREGPFEVRWRDLRIRPLD